MYYLDNTGERYYFDASGKEKNFFSHKMTQNRFLQA